MKFSLQLLREIKGTTDSNAFYGLLFKNSNNDNDNADICSCNNTCTHRAYHAVNSRYQQSLRGSLKYFEIFVPRHIRFAELRKI